MRLTQALCNWHVNWETASKYSNVPNYLQPQALHANGMWLQNTWDPQLNLPGFWFEFTCAVFAVSLFGINSGFSVIEMSSNFWSVLNVEGFSNQMNNIYCCLFSRKCSVLINTCTKIKKELDFLLSRLNTKL